MPRMIDGIAFDDDIPSSRRGPAKTIYDLLQWGIEHGMKKDSRDVPDPYNNPQRLPMCELQSRIWAIEGAKSLEGCKWEFD